VRLGLALYGYAPGHTALPLRPAMTSDAALLRIFTLRRGERIGYGGAFCAPEDMRVGIAAVGYADGLLRACGRGHLLYKGVPVWFVGRISMDKCAVSLGSLPARVGERVTVFDDTGENLRQLARRAGTIPYELLTLASHRAGRIYENE
jgi:alanine racemase